jgi:hypothetical protein
VLVLSEQAFLDIISFLLAKWAHSASINPLKSIIMQQAVQSVHIFLRPFINYIIFFLQLCLPFQSSSTNPFSPISPLIPFAQVSLDLSSFLHPGGRHFITPFGNLPSSNL